MDTEMNPVNWNWKLDGDELETVMCDINVAAVTLLKLYTEIVKLVAAVIVAVVEHTNFDAILYMDHFKLHNVTISVR